ncbi:hypothetical protein ABZ752_13625 [Streptomyces roseifaciens]
MHENGRLPADDTFQRVADLLRLAHTALSRATAALSRPTALSDTETAAVDGALGELWEAAEDLASTGPGAGAAQEDDLRTVITDMYVGEDIGRMGVLTRQVGDIAWARRASPPLPASVRELAEDSLKLIDAAHAAIVSPGSAAALDAALTGIGDRQYQLCRTLLSGYDSLDAVGAVDTAILSRCYAECAQRAAAVAQHMSLFRETAAD